MNETPSYSIFLCPKCGKWDGSMHLHDRKWFWAEEVQVVPLDRLERVEAERAQYRRTFEAADEALGEERADFEAFKERLRKTVEKLAEREEQNAASYTGLPSQAARNDAEIARATCCDVLDLLAAIAASENPETTEEGERR